jgi:hypothetical protein
MPQENFNVSQPNDGLGDKLRAAFIKVENNFTDLFNGKVDKEAGKGLSTENYTTTEKNKLANIEDFAEVNVQADFLQEDETQDDFIKNKPAIPVVGDYLLNGGYIGTAQDLENSITLQEVTAGSNRDLVDGIFQAGTLAGDSQTGVNVNQIGQAAGNSNTGSDVNQFGQNAGLVQSGNDVNQFGQSAGVGQSGNDVNQFGQGSGEGNTFNDVNLFGRETQADENGQTVFRSADGFMTRLSTLLLTASRKYIWPDKSGTIALLSDIGVSNSKNLGPTGLNQGGILTINTDTAKFDLSAGFGYVVNGHSDADNPSYTKVTWVAKIANTIPNLATQKQTYVAVDINGDLYFTNVPLTATQRRNFIRIGVLIHLNSSAVTYIDNQPTINIEIGGQVQDILEALGFRSLSGNRIFPVSNNLKIKKELGRVFKPGANFDNLTTQPHSFTLAAQEPITFRYRTQTGDEGSDITDITPAIYDLNGTITPVAATATLATIQRVYIFQDGVIRIQPGQRVFTSLNAAITALNSDVFVTDLDIAENGLYLGAIVLTRNAVDLSNISQAIFAPSIGTTANGSVASPALAYTAEDVANKQNSLAVDGTGTKYPTVDAVNALLPSPLLGNILRGNGTAYVAISEDLFQRANKTLNKTHPSRLSSWDDFITADGELNGRVSPSGHTWLVVDRNTNAQVNGEYTVSNWKAEKTSATFDIVALIPIPSTNGLKTEILAGFTSGSSTLISLTYYFNGDFLIFSFSSNFAISKVVAGVSTTLLSESASNFQFSVGDSNMKYQEKITANISDSSTGISISLSMNAFNRAYSTSDADFQRILRGATHVGIRGFRSGIISAIKNTII